jgi:hypothetical protein
MRLSDQDKVGKNVSRNKLAGLKRKSAFLWAAKGRPVPCLLSQRGRRLILFNDPEILQQAEIKLIVVGRENLWPTSPLLEF